MIIFVLVLLSMVFPPAISLVWLVRDSGGLVPAAQMLVTPSVWMTGGILAAHFFVVFSFRNRLNSEFSGYLGQRYFKY